MLAEKPGIYCPVPLHFVDTPLMIESLLLI